MEYFLLILSFRLDFAINNRPCYTQNTELSSELLLLKTKKSLVLGKTCLLHLLLKTRPGDLVLPNQFGKLVGFFKNHIGPY